MLAKTIQYEDYDGNPQSGTFYFHLSKADLITLEMSHPGGMAKFLEDVAKSNDGAKIISEFKHILLMSYGKRSEDGKTFTKNQHLREEFESSEAFSSLLLELVTDPEASAVFVNGIVPKGLSDDVAAIAARQAERETVVSTASEPVQGEPVWPSPDAPRVLSPKEIADMDAQELKSGIATGKYLIGS